ncbi:MAG: PilZ domain-containing protein [Desulfuromonadaceae bacterium]|nr:PilZ domain-containing protein [Desulfuromonadaceae bacterium]
MAEKRDHQRVDCAEKCFLYHEESKCCGAIMNISISGALVMLDSPATSIMPGNTCSFILSVMNLPHLFVDIKAECYAC